MLQYDSTPYYKSVFSLFNENLDDSKYLIIIGYSFGDKSINDMVIDSFSNNEEKKIIIIDIAEPDVPVELQESSTYFEGGVTDFDVNHILSTISG